MAQSATPMHAQGTILNVTASGNTKTPVGKLKSIGEIKPTASEIDVTTLDTTGGYKEYLPGFRDSGEITCSGFYAPGNAGQQAIITLYGSGAVVPWEVKFEDDTTVTFQGFVKSYSIGSAEVDGSPAFGLTIRVTGAVTVSAGA